MPVNVSALTPARDAMLAAATAFEIATAAEPYSKVLIGGGVGYGRLAIAPPTH